MHKLVYRSKLRNETTLQIEKTIAVSCANDLTFFVQCAIMEIEKPFKCTTCSSVCQYFNIIRVCILTEYINMD